MVNILKFINMCKIIRSKYKNILFFFNMTLLEGLRNKELHDALYYEEIYIDFNEGVFEKTYIYYFLIHDVFLFSILSIIFMYYIIDIKDIKTKFNESFFASNVYIYTFLILFIVNLVSGAYTHVVLNFQINDNLVFLLRLFIIGIFLIFFIFLKDYNYKSKKLKRHEFYLLVGVSALILITLPKCNNFISLSLLLEAYSLIAYILVAYKNTSLFSTESGIKYFIIGSFSTGITLFGIFFLYVGSASYNFGDISLFTSENPFYNSNYQYSRSIERLAEESPFSFELAKVMNDIGYRNYCYALKKIETMSKGLLESEKRYLGFSASINELVYKKVSNAVWLIMGDMPHQLRVYDEGQAFYIYTEEFKRIPIAMWDQYIAVQKIENFCDNSEEISKLPGFRRNLNASSGWFKDKCYSIKKKFLGYYQLAHAFDTATYRLDRILENKRVEDLMVENMFSLYLNTRKAIDEYIYNNLAMLSEKDESRLIYNLHILDWNVDLLERIAQATLEGGDPSYLKKGIWINWEEGDHTPQENQWFERYKSSYKVFKFLKRLRDERFADLCKAYLEWQNNQLENKKFSSGEAEYHSTVENFKWQLIENVDPNLTAYTLNQLVEKATETGYLVEFSPYFYKEENGLEQMVTIKGVSTPKEALSWKWIRDYHDNYNVFESYLKECDKVKGALDYSVLGLFFIFVGLSLKIGIAPFHIWTPDVYEGSDFWVMSFLSLVPKTTILLFLFLFVNFFNLGNYISIKVLITICLITSIFIGAFAGIIQYSTQRFLVFSGIFNLGFFLIMFIVDHPEGSSVFLYYLVFYLSVMIPIFGAFMFIRNRVDLSLVNNFYNYDSMFSVNVWLCYIISFLLFCLGGLPPFSFFISKFYILYIAVNYNLIFVVLLLLTVTCINIYYYVRVVKVIMLSKIDNCMFLVNFEKNGGFSIVGMFLLNVLFISIPNVILFFLFDYFFL